MNPMNPALILQQIKNSPLMQNPTMQNAMKMYESGDVQGLESLATNICSQRGINLSELQKRVQSLPFR